jgi:hypothetical protein
MAADRRPVMRSAAERDAAHLLSVERGRVSSLQGFDLSAQVLTIGADSCASSARQQ